MCGIAGFFRPEGMTADESLIRRMIGTLGHRGPDATGFYTQGGVSLGHARLSIIDVEGGVQPMSTAGGSLQIVFNGEIFNYIELRQELVQLGHTFATQSDTEVILHAYAEFGESCVEHFNGQWAFAIWDTRACKMFLSRDRLGVRPLYYAFVGETFVFGSEMKAILAYPGSSAELDVRGLDQVFNFWHTLPPTTAVAGISELPPGANAFVSRGEIRIRPYWDLSYGFVKFEGTPAEERNLSDELRALLADATMLRLRADVPVGAYLSGGLDSAITAALARQYNSRLRTFSVRFDDELLDEGPFQQEAVRHLGTEHSEVRCTDRMIGDAFPSVIWHTEAPVLRTAPAPMFLLSQLVRSSGYKVVLTGEGSDEMFGGYDIFKETKIRQFWASQPNSTARPQLLKRLYPYLPKVHSQSASYLAAYFDVRRPENGGPFFSHLPRWNQSETLRAFFSDDVKRSLESSDRRDEFQQSLPSGFVAWRSFERAQYLEARYLLPGYILSSQGDRMAMAHGVEGRFPFLDHRVVEFAARLDPRLKMKVLQEKYLLKKAAAPLVPNSILTRHKQPYRAPESRCFFASGQPLDYVAELLSPKRIKEDGLFNPAPVQALLEKGCRSGLVSNRDNMAFVGVLSVQLLKESLRRFRNAEPERATRLCHV